MGGAAPTAPEVIMDMTRMRCMCCGMFGMAPATTTMTREIDSVKVTVDGVPAMRCLACGAISMDGKFGIPIDEAITSILIATGVASLPTPEEEAALRAENREIVRQLGQEDTFLDETDGQPTSEPSGAGS